MKKLIYLALAAVLIASCRKDPDFSDLDNDYLVFTSYDKNTDFAAVSTFFIPDSILLIGDKAAPVYWKGETADKIIDAYVENMNARGYSRVSDKTQAELGIQLSYVEDTRFFVNYTEPYWWWGYPGYWVPGYWGAWNDWYYSYPVVYSYSVGSLLCEAVDLQTVRGNGKQLPVVWNAFMSGLLSGSDTFDLALTLRAIDQSFEQSPYIKK